MNLYCIKSGKKIGEINNSESIPCVVSDEWIDTTTIKGHPLPEQIVYLINYCMADIDRRLKVTQSIASNSLLEKVTALSPEQQGKLYIKTYKALQLNHQTTFNHYLFDDDDNFSGFDLAKWESQADDLISDFNCTDLTIHEVDKIVARRKQERLEIFERKKRNVSNLIEETLAFEPSLKLEKRKQQRQASQFKLLINTIAVDF